MVTQSHVCSGTPRKAPSHASQLLPARPSLCSRLPAADSALGEGSQAHAMGMNPGCHSSLPAVTITRRDPTSLQPSRGSSSASLAFPAAGTATNPACPHFPAIPFLSPSSPSLLIPAPEAGIMFNPGSRRSTSSLPAGSAPGASPSPRPCRIRAAGTATCPAPAGSPSGAGKLREAPGTTRCRLPAAAIRHSGDWDAAGLSCAGATRIPQPADPARSHPRSPGLVPKSGGYRTRVRGDNAGGQRRLLAHPRCLTPG